ncbi:MAG: response regulator [Sphingomicrobium sp.]
MGTIILADDDELIAAVVTDALMGAGHAVGWLADGASALEVIRQRPPDLVILDCNMPELGGIHVLREMRRVDYLHRVPVLMLTGRASAHDEHIARFAGATDYLRKPFDPVELIDRAEELMDGRRRFA